MCFDWLVTGQILTLNPAPAVPGPGHVVARGKTLVLIGTGARPPFGLPATMRCHTFRAT